MYSNLPARFVSRAKEHPLTTAQYVFIGVLFTGIVSVSFILAHTAGHMLVQQVLATISGRPPAEFAFRLGIAIFIGALAWVMPYVTWEFLTRVPVVRKEYLELPRYEMWGMIAVIPGALAAVLLWTAPLWVSVFSSPLEIVTPFVEQPRQNLYTFLIVVVPGVFSFIKLAREDMRSRDSGQFRPFYAQGHVTTASSGSHTDSSSRSSQPSPSPADSQTREPAQTTSPSTASVDSSEPARENSVAAASSGDKPQFVDFEYDWSEPPELRFNDVGGMEQLKKELMSEVIRPLSGNIDTYREFGVGIPNLLLHGPPGTGKTYIAKALAGELEFPYVKLSAADVNSQWINESGDRVATLFDEAEVVGSNYGYAVVFIDEIDALLSARTQGQQHNESKKVVNEFLNHLTETEDRNTLFIGATNNYEELDTAATRAGRLDKKVFVGLPDVDARVEILRVHLNQRPGNIPETMSLRPLVASLEGWSAADIELMVENAARRAVERGAAGIELEDVRSAISRFD